MAGANEFAVQQLTPGCLEPLALGSWFAVRSAEGYPYRPLAVRMAWVGLTATVVCMLLPHGLQNAMGRTAHALLFAPLLPIVASLPIGTVRSFLCASVARFLGTVSYGLYVWHVPVIAAINRWTPFREWTESWPSPAIGLLLFAVALPASVAVASVSWFAFERPFVRLKARFE
jgi:peptidoglycan/LPS O-acetylase OafA/YrhL